MMKRVILATLVCALALPFAGCAKKGPMEKAGEKVDETVRTIKNGGEKTTGDKVSDAAEDVKKGAENAVDEVKKN
jgi:predicted small lipoprotein YifL